MKKFVLMMTLALGVFALTGLVGCSDDDEKDILGPTAADSAKVELFMSEYSDMDEVNGQMVNFTMHFIDSIMQAGSPGRVIGAADIHVTLDWHSGSEYWYCTAVDTTDYDEVFSYIDSLQFLHGTEAVQWPVDSLLTEIRSHLRMWVTGEAIDTATAWQNLVFTVDEPQADTLHVSGTGGLIAQVNEIDIDGSDTTLCSVSFDLGLTYTDLQFDTSGDDGELGCPRAGDLAATGTFDLSCTGANEITVGGTWALTEEFDDGVIHITVQHGGFTFTGTDTCD